MPEVALLCGELCRLADTCEGAAKCGLCPLSRFYSAREVALPEVWEVEPEELPQPQRRLLDHARDMTGTLEEFHGDRAYLRVLRQATLDGVHHREVVLTLAGSGRAVEFGAISIRLDALPAGAREAVLRADRPLGALLRENGILFVSRPKAFIRVSADRRVAGALGLEGPTTLYGRCNALFTAEESILADIVEILPP